MSSTQFDAHRPSSGHPAACLSSPLLERPYPLRPGSETRIGRDGGNDIIVPVMQVSRLHAVVSWDGIGFSLVDRNSANGTTVNGERVARKRLANGDRVGIGPCEFVFKTESEAESDCPGAGQTQFAGMPGAISGPLTAVAVPELWQMIELNHKTGILVFHHDEERGAVFFTSGRAVHAEYGRLTGDAAALGLLSFTGGSFQFLSDAAVPPARTIERSSVSLLLEAARRRDEKERDMAAKDTEISRLPTVRLARHRDRSSGAIAS